MSYIRTNATLQNSFATGNIGSAENSAMSSAGGLVGYVSRGGSGTVDIYNCYATGNVYTGSSGFAAQGVGGLVGYAGANVTFRYVHATGNVTTGRTDNGVGGLIGYISANSANIDTPTIQYAYATGNVSVNTDDSSGNTVGGLVG